jgi:RNA polymerase sigma-70 factor (ECF subfamily)
VKARTNDEWLRDLRTTGPEQSPALADLRAHLLRAARYALRRSGHLAHRHAADLDQLAEDCAQEALLGVLRRLGNFRGDSRFTTWAYTFAVHAALVAARREAWRTVSLDAMLQDARGLTRLADVEAPDVDPERAARRREAWTVIRDVLEHELTDRQRQALTALFLSDVPLDELARHWQSSRNAIYKLVHDARRRLKARLEARGFPSSELLGLFVAPG